jgi:prepilin-type N-terminal cleavage/methylation domain-containing protein
MDTGLSLVEILIVLVIVAAFAAVIYPSVATQLRRGQATALGNQLGNLRDAIANYRQNVGRYPNVLTLLTTQPVNGDDDSCGANLPTAGAAGITQWRGPYLTQNVSGNFPVGDATMQNAIVRVPATTATTQVGVLQIQAINVDATVAADLEQQFDGNNNLAAGTIRWIAASGGTLTFEIPIRGC